MDKIRTVPNFIVIGAAKSGTTTLFEILKGHADVFIPKQKELGFFSNAKLYEKGLDWYRNEFFFNLRPQQLAGDISPQYMYFEDVAQRIQSQNPDAKIIAILRNPIDRAFSHYRHTVRLGLEQRPFDVAFEASTERKTIIREQYNPRYEYYLQGLYGVILSSYFKCFSRRQIKIVFLEQLKRKPLKFYFELCDFLSLDRAYVPSNLGQTFHKGGTRRFPILEDFIFENAKLRRVARRFASKSMIQELKSLRTKIEHVNIKPTIESEIDTSLRKRIAEAYMEDVRLLCELTDIKPWQEFDGCRIGDR